MNFRFARVVFLSFIGLLACDTASNIDDPDLDYFVKYYGGDGNQYGVDMLPLQDGTFLLLGNYSVSASQTDIYLLRVDAEGEVIWEKRFGQEGELDPPNHNAKDLERTNDGNIIILSDYQSPFGNQMDFKLLKIAPDGSLISSKIEGHPRANDFSHTVTPLADGGFMVSGTTEFTKTFNLASSPDPDLGDFFNYRFDATLNRLLQIDWSPVSPGFGGKLDVAVKAIEIEIEDQDPEKEYEYYVFGYSNINLNDTNENERLGLFYFKRESKGGEVNPFYPGNVEINNDTEIHFAKPVPAEMGGGFMIIGTSSDNLGFSKIFMTKLRSRLNFVETDATLYITVPLGRNVRGVSAASSLSGEYGYLVLGNEVRANDITNIWLSKIDQSGAVLWSTTFGSEAQNDFGAAVTQLPDGKILILGTMGLADQQFKMAFIKMNPRGELLK